MEKDSVQFEQLSDKGIWKVMKVTRHNPKLHEIKNEFCCTNSFRYFYSANLDVTDALAEYLNDIDIKTSGAI